MSLICRPCSETRPPSQNWLRVHRSCERNLSYLSMKCISALADTKILYTQSMVTTRTGKSTEEYRHRKCSRHPRGGVKCATCFRAGKTERELIALEKHCQTKKLSYPCRSTGGGKAPRKQSSIEKEGN